MLFCLYLQKLFIQKIGRGIAWLDTGTPQALLQAANFFGVIDERQGLKVGCIEEISCRKGFVDKKQFKKIISDMPKCSYRSYLENVLKEI